MAASYGWPGQPPGCPLARAMQEVGFGCSIDAATFRGMIQQVDGVLDDAAVAEVLATMARTTPANLPAEQLAAIANGGIPPAASVHGDSSNSGVVGWAWRVVLDAVKACALSLNWAKVAEALDNPSFMIHSVEGFYLLVHAYRYGSGGEQLPVKAVVGRRWNNEVGQLSFLQYAVSAPPEVFSFAASERKLPPVEGLQGGKSPVGTPNQAWLSIDLLQIMCHFTVDATKRPAVLAMLEFPIKHCPEVLLLAMASVPEDTQLLQREVYSVLLPPYLNNSQANTQLVLHRLWGVNPKLVKEMLVEYFVQDPQNLPRIYDICHELQALPDVLADTPSCRFALHLAVYAVQAKTSSVTALEQWAGSRLAREPVMMVHEAILFLYARISGLQPNQLGRPTNDVVACLMRMLVPLRSQLAWDFLDAFNYVADLACKAYPGLKQLVQSPIFSAEVEAEAKATLQRVHAHTKSVEEVVSQLQKLKTGGPRDQELCAAILWTLLNEFPTYLYDQYQAEKDLQAAAMLYAATISQQTMPRVALGMALRFVVFALRAQPRVAMFGLTVLRQIVRIIRPLGSFCEQVLLSPTLREADPQLYSQVEAAYREYQVAVHAGEVTVQYAMLPPLSLPGMPPPSPPAPGPGPALTKQPAPGMRPPGMSNPGAGQAGGPAGQWPGAVGAGMAPPPGPALPWAHRDVAAPNPAPSPMAGGVGAGLPAKRTDADRGKQSMEGNDIEGELETTLLAPAPQVQPAKGPTLGVNTMSLENASQNFPAPPEGVHDRVHFLINNLSEENMEQRASEIKGKVFPNYVGWFSEYMAKRAAQEPNYQPLYLRMLDKVGDRALFKQLTHSTYYYVKLLLTGDRAVNNSNDRALLKNLGHWLGALSFKRDKPVLSKELDLKQIVIEAYQGGRLVSVLPFLSNLLSCCEKSRVFTATNPMICGLLSLLAELHKLPHLKFNAQYCIEMIFKTFSNPTVEPTNILATLQRSNMHNQDFTNIVDDGMDKGLMSAEAASNMQAMMNAAAVKAFNQHVVGGSRTPVKGPPPGVGPTPAGAGPPPSMGTPTATMAGVQAASMASGAATPGGIAAAMEATKQESLQMQRAAVAAAAAGGGAAGAAGAPPGMHVTGPMAAPPTPPAPQPTGLCMDHNAMIQYLSQNAIINPSLGAIIDRLALKRHAPTAIERAIWEILNPVVERSVTIACYTTYELLSKDFALDGDEIRMRKAAHLMVSSLAGSLALVTCKDPLRIALGNHLTQLLTAHLGQQQVDKTLEEVVTVVVQDNLESCCSVFERAATEKAVRDVDKQLADKYEERIQAKKQGRPFADNSAFHGRFPTGLPESLRPRPGMIGAMQLRVYEDFARIPRSPPPTAPATPMGPPGMRFYGPMAGEDGMAGKQGVGMPGAGVPMAGGAANMEVVQQQYQSWQALVDAAATKAEAAGEQASQELNALMQELMDYVASLAPEDALRFFIQRMFGHLFEVAAMPGLKLAVPFYVQALRHTCDALAAKSGSASAHNLCGSWNMMVDDERRFNRDAVEELLRAGLMGPLPEFDLLLARTLMAVRSAAAQELVAHLAKTLLLRDHVLAFTDLAQSVDALQKLSLAMRGNSHAPAALQADQYLALVEQVRRAAAGALQPIRPPNELPVAVRDKADPPGAKEAVQAQLEEWLRLSSNSPSLAALATNPGLAQVPEADRAALAAYLSSLRASGWFKDEVTTERWVRLCVDIAVTHSLTISEQAAMQGRVAEAHQLYLGIDALWRLLAALTLHGGHLPFLHSTLSVMVGVIKRDADERTIAFNGRPHLRLFVGLMNELLAGGGASYDEAMTTRYVRLFAEALHALQPLSVPGWAFCWLTAIAHRAFMPRLLLQPGNPLYGWLLYEGLLVALLRFLEPHLRASDQLTDCVRALYKGTLRLLLVLLHDFPEFLCEHHFPLCDAIPVSCVQLRNLVLSAFPRSMRLPDPFTPGLKVDLLPEIMQVPRVVPEPERLLDRHEALRTSIDSFLRSRTPASLPSDLARAFKLNPSGPATEGGAAAGKPGASGPNYHTSLINAVVMYVGAMSTRSVTAPPPGDSARLDGPALDIFLRLMSELDSEGRYLVLNAAANQLRYPNSHTYAFSCLLLGLFLEVKSEVVQEQVTRVLLERLVVNRPHPWGLLITFIELIKNPRYMFWTHEFTRNGPDVERLFKNVAASCMAHTGSPGAGGAPATPGGVAERKEGEDGVRAA